MVQWRPATGDRRPAVSAPAWRLRSLGTPPEVLFAGDEHCKSSRHFGWSTSPLARDCANDGRPASSSRATRHFACTVAMAVVLHSAAALAQSTEPANVLPLVPPASNVGQQGFVRIINHSDSGGTVRIHAIDDTGRSFGPISLSLDAKQTRHFNSGDLERGNAAKGLPDGVGDGTDNWRLELSADVDFEALAYIRTPDGFVTSMHEVAVEADEGTNRYQVPFVNPGSNRNQESRLRVVNPGGSRADIVITAVDDAGDAAPLGEVSLTLDAGAARMLSARELEQGGSGLTGRLGDGWGKWQLSVAGNQPLFVMSLLQLPTGHLTNLSRGRDVVVADPSAAKPDLVVQSASVNDSSPSAGQSFTLRATVRNSGAARSVATTLRYYRSSDATISTSDTPVGTDPVSALAASAKSDESIRLNAPSTAGTYYYGACVDTVSEESNTANNCSSAVTVTVSGGGGTTYGVGDSLPGVSSSTIPSIFGGGSISSSGGVTTITLNNGSYIQLRDGTRYTCRASGGCTIRNGVVARGTIVGGGGTPPPPPNGPDLVVQSPTVSDSTPNAGASFTLRATVRNSGAARSAATTLRYYRSSDATISTSDTAVGTDAVSALVASGTSAESISLTAPASAGTYYYGACVDTVTGESNTRNNCSRGVRVTVQGSSGPAITVSGGSCTVTRTSFLAIDVRMSGTLNAHRSVSSVRVDGYANGQLIDTEFVGNMSSGQSKRFTLTGTLLDSSATRVNCRVEWSALERRSQGGGEVRGKSSMHGPSQVVD